MNRYLIDIKNDPNNTDLEHNYEEDEAPVSCKNFLLLADMSEEDGFFFVAHHMNVNSLSDLLLKLCGQEPEAYSLLKASMTIAEAKVKAYEIMKEANKDPAAKFMDALMGKRDWASSFDKLTRNKED